MLKSRRKKKPETTREVTTCCETDTYIQKCGAELLLRCTKCDEYIGHVVSRPIALVDIRYSQLIAQACSDRGIEFPSEEEFNSMYETYCDNVLEFAKQAARHTVTLFIREKRLNKC